MHESVREITFLLHARRRSTSGDYIIQHYITDLSCEWLMRAIQKLQRAPGLILTDIPKPTCGLTDVVIEVHHAGVCGTDLHIADWGEIGRAHV